MQSSFEQARVSARDAETLTTLFDGVFAVSDGTRLVRGDREPMYLPRDESCPFDLVIFAHGFFSSGLHEISHWCLAGRERRRIADYGYWYKPDDRNEDEQRLFETVEVRPQALEWLFSVAAGSVFHFSADNLSPGGATVPETWVQFQQRVLAQVHAFAEHGLPPRASRFAEALCRFYGTGRAWTAVASYRL